MWWNTCFWIRFSITGLARSNQSLSGGTAPETHLCQITRTVNSNYTLHSLCSWLPVHMSANVCHVAQCWSRMSDFTGSNLNYCAFHTHPAFHSTLAWLMSKRVVEVMAHCGRGLLQCPRICQLSIDETVTSIALLATVVLDGEILPWSSNVFKIIKHKPLANQPHFVRTHKISIINNATIIIIIKYDRQKHTK